MPLPKLNEVQANEIVQQVADYIENQRQIYRDKAWPLKANQRTAMAPFFSESALDSTRIVVLNNQRIGNPEFYDNLVRMGFDASDLPDFSGMAAITLVDTVVFHDPIENRVLFHELVHAVQYEKLGLIGFAAKYVKGFLTRGSYEAIPLERNAYDLDRRFAEAPGSVFSVHDEVQDWIDWELF